MKRHLIRSVPALVGLCIMIFIGIQLSTSVYHNNLTRYGIPICSIDRHGFEGGVCPECGAEVAKNGVFFSASVAEERPYGNDYQLKFTDFYPSWVEFEADYSLCLSYSNAMLAVIVLEVFTYVTLFVRSGRNKGGRLK